MVKFNAPLYLQLNADGSQARLFILKINAVAHSQNRPLLTRMDWRLSRAYTFNNWSAAYCDLSQSGNTWYAHTGAQFRNEKVEKYSSFFTGDCGPTINSIVANLNHGRFIAGYACSDNGERAYFNKIFTCYDKALLYANSEAENYAKLCMEDNEKYEAAIKIDNKIDDLLIRLRECVALRNIACMSYVRNEILVILNTIRDCRLELKHNYAGVL